MYLIITTNHEIFWNLLTQDSINLCWVVSFHIKVSQNTYPVCTEYCKWTVLCSTPTNLLTCVWHNISEASLGTINIGQCRSSAWSMTWSITCYVQPATLVSRIVLQKGLWYYRKGYGTVYDQWGIKPAFFDHTHINTMHELATQYVGFFIIKLLSTDWTHSFWCSKRARSIIRTITLICTREKFPAKTSTAAELSWS